MRGSISFAGALLMMCSWAGAVEWYVDQDNVSGTYDGQSWATAYATIQAGIDAAAGGGEVWVAEGIYTQTVSLRANVNVYGGFAGNEAARTDRRPALHVTAIDGENTRRCVVGANCTIDGFTITRGKAGGGGGLYNVGASPQVVNCTFSENEATTYGGGVFNNGGAPTFEACWFCDNVAPDGGGMCNIQGASPTLTNCVFCGNEATSWGAAMCNAHAGTNPTITNCTFSGNAATSGGGTMSNNLSSVPTVTNCVLWLNTPDEIYDFPGNAATVSYSCVLGGYQGTGNIGSVLDDDPLFVDDLNEDFQLTAGSPCIDTGTATGAPVTDILSVARPQGNGVDMGAYEFAGAVPAGADSDGDGLTDDEETKRWGTDANDIDTDADGMPDGYEALYALDPRDITDAEADADDDGFTNFEEYLKGANPNDPDSPLRTYFVSSGTGSDVTGNGSLATPWQTIAYAITQVAATQQDPAQLLLLPGSYLENVTLEPWLGLAGSLNGNVFLFGGGPTLVTGANGSTLRNLHVGATPEKQNTVLLEMNDVAMDVLNVIFQGDVALGAKAIVCRGEAPADSVVSDCYFAVLGMGMEIFGGIPTVRRSIFTQITDYAVVFREDDKTLNPLTNKSFGEEDDPETGYNVFDDTDSGIVVLNERAEEVSMENNEWSSEDPTEVTALVQGSVDVTPILAKSGALEVATVECIVWDVASLLHITNATVQVGTFTVTENTHGAYTFACVAPGTYDVTANATGYAAYAQTGLAVTAGQIIPVPIQLTAASPGTDTDGDGLSDTDEENGTFGYVTNPEKADSDGDGINDDVELAYGSDPNSNTDPGTCIPPGIPQNVSATDGTYTDRVEVTWSAVDDASSYTVFRNTSDDLPEASELAEGVTTTTYADTSAASGQTYYYWVQAENSCGTGLCSEADCGQRGTGGSSGGCGALRDIGAANPPRGSGGDVLVAGCILTALVLAGACSPRTVRERVKR